MAKAKVIEHDGLHLSVARMDDDSGRYAVVHDGTTIGTIRHYAHGVWYYGLFDHLYGRDAHTTGMDNAVAAVVKMYKEHLARVAASREREANPPTLAPDPERLANSRRIMREIEDRRERAATDRAQRLSRLAQQLALLLHGASTGADEFVDYAALVSNADGTFYLRLNTGRRYEVALRELD